jgi:glycosyltransferase involved in cell wall biosynthesis
VSGALPVAVRLVTAGAQVATLHDMRDDDTRIVGEMERELIVRATHVLPNTQATLDNTIKTYGVEIATDRRTIVPYGIVPAADDAVRYFDPARAAQPGPAGDLTVLFVGRLEKRKGITDLFEAIPAVLRAVPHARFVIAGADNSRHDGFADRTGLSYPAYFAQTYPACAERVSFMGAVSDDDLQALYQSCDLFVAPSLYESFGLVYIEAMNYGKPVIGCHAGGIPEVVEDGVTGTLVEPEAPAQLAAAISAMLKSPGRMREFGQAGRAQVTGRFTYTRMAEQFAAAYRRAIAAHAQGTK